MDSRRYSVRPFRDSDYEVYARLRNRYRPAQPLSTEELRHRAGAYLAPGGLRRWYVAVEEAGHRPVAWAALDQRSYNYDPRRCWANVFVDPDHQGRGIGRTLSSLLEEEARRHEMVALWAEVRADFGRGVEFFLRQGFSELRRRRLSRVDLAAANVGGLPDRARVLRFEGIEFATLATEGPDREEVRRRYYELVRSAEADAPELGGRTPRTYEQFVRAELRAPGFFPEGTFLARTSSEFVGVTALERVGGDPGRVRVAFTGTSPRYRHQGIATELKRRAIGFAQRLGYLWMDTETDAANVAIGTINEGLGFKTMATYVLGEKRLRPDG